MALKIEYGDPIKVVEPPKNAFEVEINVYYGDADGFSSFVVGPFTPVVDNWALESLLRTLKAMYEEYAVIGRGGGSEYSYSHVPGFDHWFGGDSKVGDERSVEFRASALVGHPSWPADPFMEEAWGDLHAQATYDNHTVYYYDDQGAKSRAVVELA